MAGVVQTVKMKTTRNNSMMAYITLEDDTAAMEMLAFSNVLSQYGTYLRENQPVVIVGRLSMRDEKEPQIVINRARPISDYAAETAAKAPKTGTLFLRMQKDDAVLFRKIRAIVGMFPGDGAVVLYNGETGSKMGARAALDDRMIRELTDILGKENVVLK